MKSYFYSALAAGMLFATSCTQDEMVDITKGEGQHVTFTIELPSTDSRAIDHGVNVGGGNMANTLLFAMYEEDNRKVEPLVSNFVDRQADGTFKVTVPMAKDIKYDILFLAYNKANPAFLINQADAKANNLNALQLRKDLSANQESYDAFVGMLDSHGIKDGNTVRLTRPFAQINAVTTLNDLNAAATLQSIVNSSQFIIYDAPDTYDVFNGKASGETTLTYTKAAILEDAALANDADAYPRNEKFGTSAYYYLTLAYVLAGESSTSEVSTHNAEFKFYRKNDDACVTNLDIVSLPIQRNHRTIVMGELLTKYKDYTITIQAGFTDNDHTVNSDGTMVAVTEEELLNIVEKAVEGKHQ